MDWKKYHTEIIDGTSFELYENDNYQALIKIVEAGIVVETKQYNNFIRGYNSYFTGLNLFA